MSRRYWDDLLPVSHHHQESSSVVTHTHISLMMKLWPHPLPQVTVLPTAPSTISVKQDKQSAHRTM